MLRFKQLSNRNQESKTMRRKTMTELLSSYAGTLCGIVLITSLLQSWQTDSILVPALTGLAVWSTSFLALTESYLARHLKIEWLGL